VTGSELVNVMQFQFRSELDSVYTTRYVSSGKCTFRVQ
jgi:hypothetical protein